MLAATVSADIRLITFLQNNEARVDGAENFHGIPQRHVPALHAHVKLIIHVVPAEQAHGSSRDGRQGNSSHCAALPAATHTITYVYLSYNKRTEQAEADAEVRVYRDIRQVPAVPSACLSTICQNDST